MFVSFFQCLLELERLSVWLSGGQELCVWNEDFQLQCHKQNHSDNGGIVTVNLLAVYLLPHCWHTNLFFAIAFVSAFCRNNRTTRAAEELRSWCHG